MPFPALQNSTSDLPTVQVTQFISKLLCNFCLIIHPCDNTDLQCSCIISLEAMRVQPSAIPGVNAFMSPSPLSLTLSEGNSKRLQKQDLTLPQTTSTSNSSSDFVKYFPPLFLAQMPDLIGDSSYMSSRLKNTTATRRVDCAVPATFVWYHSNLKQNSCTPCLAEATFHPLRYLKTPG